MKNILILIHDDEGQESRLQAALDVTRAIGGHLECLDVAIPPLYVGDYFSGTGGAMLLADERDAENANRQRLEQRLAREDVSWTWTNVVENPALAIKKAADLADLIVVSSSALKAPEDLHDLAGKAARETGCLVLAVPPSATGIDLAGTALIAWDGSPEANHALRDAVPLLGLAADTIVLEVDGGGANFAHSGAEYLSRHGIHPSVETIRRDSSEPVFAVILDRARAARAGYVLMGAFGHSATFEKVFGGITDSMLHESDLPLLIAH